MRAHLRRWWLPLTSMVTLFALAGCDGSSPYSPPTGTADSIVVEPDTLFVSIEDVANFLVTTFDSTGTEVVAPVTWASSDESVCLVNSSGQVTGVTEGITSVIATSGAASDTGVVIVTPGSGGWQVQASSLSGSRFNGVFFLADGRNGWACGDGGRIVRTSDAGSNWSILTTPTTSRLNAIWFVDADLGFAVGVSGLVLTTANGGTTWTRILSVPAAENLHDVHFANADSGWVVGAAGVGLRTIDGGATWERVGMAVTDLNGVSFFGSREGWAVGNGGLILGTVDGGESWSLVQPSVTGLTLMGVWRASSARANAVGVGGAAPRTVAGAWEFVNAGSLFSLEDVCFVDDNTGWAVGQNVTGAILRTDNGGASWTTQAPNTSARLRDVFFVDRFRGWAVGDNGTILHTVSGGAP